MMTAGKREEGSGKRRAIRRSLLATLVVALAVGGPAAGAQAGGAQEVPPAPVRVQDVVIGTPETEAVAQAAMGLLRSPVTPFHMLDMCPDQAAAALRDTLRVEAAAGATTAQLVDGVIARYGERMRAVPEQRGAGLWAWLAPPAVLILGGLFVLMKLRGMRREEEPQPAPAGSGLSEAERSELDAAMREFETSTEEV